MQLILCHRLWSTINLDLQTSFIQFSFFVILISLCNVYFIEIHLCSIDINIVFFIVPQAGKVHDNDE